MSGIISDPNKSPECYITISAPEGKYITLYFNSFTLGISTTYKVNEPRKSGLTIKVPMSVIGPGTNRERYIFIERIIFQKVKFISDI